VRVHLNALFNSFTADADAEGRTDLRGLVAGMVRACVIGGEACVIPAEMVDESITRDRETQSVLIAGMVEARSGQREALNLISRAMTTFNDTIDGRGDEVLPDVEAEEELTDA
jgi:hypothetical protein